MPPGTPTRASSEQCVRPQTTSAAARPGIHQAPAAQDFPYRDHHHPGQQARPPENDAAGQTRRTRQDGFSPSGRGNGMEKSKSWRLTRRWAPSRSTTTARSQPSISTRTASKRLPALLPRPRAHLAVRLGLFRGAANPFGHAAIPNALPRPMRLPSPTGAATSSTSGGATPAYAGGPPANASSVSLPAFGTASSAVSQPQQDPGSQLTREQQAILLEAQKQRYESTGNPIASLIPPVPPDLAAPAASENGSGTTTQKAWTLPRARRFPLSRNEAAGSQRFSYTTQDVGLMRERLAHSLSVVIQSSVQKGPSLFSVE